MRWVLSHRRRSASEEKAGSLPERAHSKAEPCREIDPVCDEQPRDDANVDDDVGEPSEVVSSSIKSLNKSLGAFTLNARSAPS